MILAEYFALLPHHTDVLERRTNKKPHNIAVAYYKVQVIQQLELQVVAWTEQDKAKQTRHWPELGETRALKRPHSPMSLYVIYQDSNGIWTVDYRIQVIWQMRDQLLKQWTPTWCKPCWSCVLDAHLYWKMHRQARKLCSVLYQLSEIYIRYVIYNAQPFEMNTKGQTWQ